MALGGTVFYLMLILKEQKGINKVKYMEENNTKRSKKIIIIVGIALVVIIAAVVTNS